MNRRRRTLGLMAAAGVLVLLGWAVLRVNGDGVSAPNCGVSSVWDLSYLLGRPVPDRVQQEVAQAYTAPEISMLQVREIARGVGLDLVGVRASLDDLDGEGYWPAIIHVTNPEHFVVLARLSPEWVQVIDRGGPTVYARAALEKRYSGHALVLRLRRATGPGPRIEIAPLHYTFTVTGRGQPIEREFVCSNRGDANLTLKARAADG